MLHEGRGRGTIPRLTETNLQKQYWRFYWPLALMGVGSLLGRQVQNSVLASFDVARELAIFAYASSVYFLLNSVLVFIPQLSNVLARDRQSHRVCLLFTAGLAAALTAAMAVLVFAPVGRTLVAMIFQVSPADLDSVLLYLRLMAPLLPAGALRQYYTGLLVQDRLTGTLTVLHVIQLVLAAAIMLLGLWARWSAVTTVVSSIIASEVTHAILLSAIYLRRHRFPCDADPRADAAALRYRDVWAYFWPTATTSVMFSFSRPVIFSYVSRLAQADATTAALRVAFDFAMLFHAPLNQFRHLFAVFGAADPAGVRRFMIRVTLAATVLMLLVAGTPLAGLVLGKMMGVRGQVLEMSRQALLVLCLVPLTIGIRNWFHGRMLTGRHTGGMAAGGILRVAATWLATWAFQAAGMLDHISAAAVLVLGFAMEALTCLPFTARLHHLSSASARPPVPQPPPPQRRSTG